MWTVVLAGPAYLALATLAPTVPERESFSGPCLPV